MVCNYKVVYLDMTNKQNNTMETLKLKVISKLIKNGNNPQEVIKMVEHNFDYASKYYTTVNKIAECIRTIY